jgi:hypothetical protein
MRLSTFDSHTQEAVPRWGAINQLGVTHFVLGNDAEAGYRCCLNPPMM